MNSTMSDISGSSDIHGSSMLYNMIITTSISIVITSLTSSIRFFVNNIYDIVRNFNIYYIFCKKNTKCSITISSKTMTGMGGSVFSRTVSYNAIMHHINKKKINIPKLEEVLNIDRYSRMDHQSEYNIKPYNKDILLDEKNDIRARFTSSINDMSSNEVVTKIYENNIELFSNKLTSNELLDIINDWVFEYNIYKKRYVETENNYYYWLSYNEIKNNIGDIKNEQPNKKQLVWKNSKISTYKTFENIFFKNKENVLNKLNFFLNNKEYYKKYGIPYNIGFLFHGEPGCGKTSCIKAIMNHTKRKHIIEINLGKIKTCGEFIDVFTTEFYCDKYVPVDKKIIIFEDADCMVDSVLDDREQKKEEDKEEDSDCDTSTKILNKLLDSNNKPSKIDKDDKLNLSCILNMLDGILEHEGRILIMTTNYKHKLDKALIRPGRIDVDTCFTLCDNKMMHDIINFYCNTKIDENITFEEDKYSPAKLINLCIEYQNDVDELVNIVKK